jgi:hypothetical protein
MPDLEIPSGSSTSETAGNVVDAFEAADSAPTPEPSPTPSEPPPTAPPSEPAPTPGEPVITAPAVPVVPRSEAEQLLHDAGYKHGKKPDGRENYIPHSKVVKILENGLREGKGQFGAQFKAVETEAKQLRAQREDIQRDILGDPETFLSKLATVDPRYRRFLEPRAPAPAQAAPANGNGDRPKPDIDLGKFAPEYAGQWTYSVEGVQKLAQWEAAQILDARLKPLEDRDKAAQSHAETVRIVQAAHQRVQGTLQEAQGWPQFGPMAADGSLTEFQTAVLGRLQADSKTAAEQGRRPAMTLKEAYQEERIARLAEDDTAKRARILDELNAAPKGTAVPRSGSDTPRKTPAISTSDIASKVLSRMER